MLRFRFLKNDISFNRTWVSTFSVMLLWLAGLGCQRDLMLKPDVRTDAAARQSLRSALPIYDGEGHRRKWAHVLGAAEKAEVVVVGEQHDDAIGHAVQLALVEDMLDRWPDTALSMEMLDRREQAAVDDYLAGMIDRELFMTEISAAPFRKVVRLYLDRDIDRKTLEKQLLSVGWPDWENNYQPIIDRAKEAGTIVIASNTPWARYTSLANKEGFARLAALTQAQRALVETPDFLPSGPYRKRFFDLMSGNMHGEPKKSGEGAPQKENEAVVGMYRAQCVMDATMADSIARCLEARPGRVIHLVGQFHSDFTGGLIQQLLHRRPTTRVVNISVQAVPATDLRKEDRGRADFVVYHPG